MSIAQIDQIENRPLDTYGPPYQYLSSSTYQYNNNLSTLRRNQHILESRNRGTVERYSDVSLSSEVLHHLPFTSLSLLEKYLHRPTMRLNTFTLSGM
eukprot:scaffold4130_cov112-Skeletonema_dohrnii-CCMP3373.AAC.5